MNEVYSMLAKMYKENPSIELSVECFKYKRSGEENEDRPKASANRVVTHIATENFRYESCKDVSGDLMLEDLGDLGSVQRVFVLLHFHLSIQYANDGTREDKASFLLKNKKDQQYSYTENVSVPGFVDHVMVRTTDRYGPDFVGLGWYVFFSLLSFNILYVHYLDCFILEQHYAVQKLVSTRRNLSSEESPLRKPNPAAGPKVITRSEAAVYSGESNKFAALACEPFPQIMIRVRPPPAPQTATTMMQFAPEQRVGQPEGTSALDMTPANGASVMGGMSANLPLVPAMGARAGVDLGQVRIEIKKESEAKREAEADIEEEEDGNIVESEPEDLQVKKEDGGGMRPDQKAAAPDHEIKAEAAEFSLVAK